MERNMKLYPLKFKTIFKEKIWGGNKIKTILGKDISPLKNCGETWELSSVPGNISIVNEGELMGYSLTALIDRYKENLVGNRIYQKFGSELPLLIKFIDANQDLSIQVHPGDKLAKLKHDSFGKTEMWYIIQADDNSTLISGFNKSITKEEYVTKFNNGEILEVLNQIPVMNNDMFFIPAGRIHTIGKGLLLAEIQQTSDITYRIYDYDRIDDQGNKRELHNDLALEAIDFSVTNNLQLDVTKKINQPNAVVTCPYFTTNKFEIEGSVHRNFNQLDSFIIYIVLEGKVSISLPGHETEINKGEVLLIPSVFKEFEISSSKGKLLEVYID